MANMTIAKRTSKPICRRGAMALMMDLSTTCRPVRGMGYPSHEGHSIQIMLVWVTHHIMEGMNSLPMALIGNYILVSYITVSFPETISVFDKS